uniref:Uncharacterized protein n=1 Tax=Picea glauca TaxID=3330 RepID=A0A117NHZ6_PICGL|nr:hypothetical protein ABT39_MTgene3722 [Picea glauca]
MVQIQPFKVSLLRSLLQSLLASVPNPELGSAEIDDIGYNLLPPLRSFFYRLRMRKMKFW